MIKKLALLASLLCLSHSGFATWKTLSPAGKATARHESGLVAHNKQVFVVGGRGIKAIDVYDPAKNAWRNNKPTPFEMHHITPVSVGDKILVVTGLTGRYPKEAPLTHIWEYDPKNDEWKQGMEIPKERRRGGAGVTVHEGKVYLVGGIKLGHTSGTSNMVDVYNPANQSWRQLTDAPHIRDHANAAIIDNKLIAFGGRNSSYHEPKSFTAFFAQVNDKVDVYDFDTKAWRRKYYYG
jgi:N-acetylneuraminic acid mutarotase